MDYVLNVLNQWPGFNIYIQAPLEERRGIRDRGGSASQASERLSVTAWGRQQVMVEAGGILQQWDTPAVGYSAELSVGKVCSAATRLRSQKPHEATMVLWNLYI